MTEFIVQHMAMLQAYKYKMHHMLSTISSLYVATNAFSIILKFTLLT